MKRLASLLALLFFVQNVVFATGVEPFAPLGKPKAMPLPSWLTPSFSAFAKVENIHPSFGKQPKTIVILQDAHLHTEAQESIAGVIDTLGRAAAEHGEKLQVGLEGTGRSRVNFSRYDAYPFRQSLHEAAESFLKKNIINGAEFAVIGYLGNGGDGSINSPFVVSGVEEPSQYNANVEALRVSERLKQKAEKSLSELAQRLKTLKEKHYSPELFAFDQKFAAYEAGNLSVPGYALYLDSIVPARTTQLQNLISASLIEGSINMRLAEKERGAFLAAVMRSMSPKESEKLLQTSKLLRSGLLSHADYYRILKNAAQSKGVSLSAYPEMKLYTQYIDLCDRIDNEALFDELDELEQAVQDKLAQTLPQREITSLSKAYSLMKKLVERRLTEAEWKRYSSTKKGQESFWREFERFYEVAEIRSATMAAKMRQAMERSGASTGVLVAGGFHAQKIFSELSKENVNVVMMSPNIKNVGDAPSSIDYLLAGRAPIDQLFTGERLFLNVAPATAGPHAGPLADAILLEASRKRLPPGEREPDHSYFGMTSNDMVSIIVNAIPTLKVWQILERRFVDIVRKDWRRIQAWMLSRAERHIGHRDHDRIAALVEFLDVRSRLPLNTKEDYIRAMEPVFVLFMRVPEFSGKIWEAAGFPKGDRSSRSMLQNNLEHALRMYFKDLPKHMQVELLRERANETSVPYLYVEPHAEYPGALVMRLNQAGLNSIMGDAKFHAERAAEKGVLLTDVQSRLLVQSVVFGKEIDQAFLDVSDEQNVQHGLADSRRVKAQMAKGIHIDPFITNTGVFGEIHRLIWEEIVNSYGQTDDTDKLLWARNERRFRRVALGRESMSASEFREREIQALGGLAETGRILQQLVPNPNGKIALNYAHIEEGVVFDNGLMPQDGFEKLMASLDDQSRHRVIDDTVNRRGKEFVNAADVYTEAGLYGQGTMVVWDQKGGYHDVLVYADKIMKSKRHDFKEISVLQNNGEFRQGLRKYLEMLISGKHEGKDVDAEIALAVRVEEHIKKGRLKVVSLPETIVIPKMDGRDAYDITDAIQFFEGKADARNCGRLMFVSDWRTLTMQEKAYRTTVEFITNMNLFVTMIDGVLRIATYAAKQA